MSWLDRLSELHGMRRDAMAEQMGVRYSTINAIMLFPRPLGLCGVEAATGLTSDQVSAMTLQRYEDTALWMLRGVERSAVVGNKPSRYDWIRYDCSNACPSCLAADGNRWKLSWRLSWTFMCLRHRTFLTSSCQCGRLLNQQAQTDRTAGCAGCGLQPKDLPVAAVSDPQLVELQGRLDRLVAGDSSPASARSMLAEFRTAMHFALYVGEPQMLADRTDPSVAKRFAQACRLRDESMFAMRMNGEVGYTSRFWSLRDRLPDALLLAGISLLAADLVFARDIDGAVSRFLDGCRMSSIADVARWQRFGAAWEGTPRLRNAVTAAGGPLPTFSTKFRMTRGPAATATD